MEIKNVKNQHYVWRHYLKPWMTDGKLWCRREDSIFFKNPYSLAVDEYFYEAHPLNQTELKVLSVFFDKMHPDSHEVVGSILQLYLAAASSTEVIRKNTIEAYHTLIENTAIEVLDQIYTDDLGFWNIEQKRLMFSQFLGLQYMRTKKSHDDVSKAFDLNKKSPLISREIDSKHLSTVLNLVLAEVIGNWLFSEAQPTLLENDPGNLFITGDQPIFNLKADVINSVEIPKEIVLFYPVSPRRAILFRSDNWGKIDESLSTRQLNRFIKQVSREYLFGSTKDCLETV